MSLMDRLGLELPIIQAPMAGSQNFELAEAVSKAGALGSIPCGMLGPDQAAAEIEQFRQKSDSPYNLNFFCHQMPSVTEHALAEWRQCLAGFYAELAIDPTPNTSALRLPFSHEMADRIEPYRPPVMSFHFGLPEITLLNRVKAWGSIIISSATSLEEALWLEAQGVDAVIAQGVEAGGHRGMFISEDLGTQIPTFELLECCTKQLTVPVIAAGGISNAAGIKRALDMGAEAVQLGTIFLLCDEAKTSAVHRQALKTSQSSTAMTNLFSGRPARGIRNRLMQSLGDLHPKAPAFPYATPDLVALRQAAESKGLGDFSPLWSGTDRSGCQEISAIALLDDLGKALGYQK